MSVILDALHKARGDRRGQAPDQAVPHEQTIARVLDAASAPPSVNGVPRPSRQRQWMIAFGAIVFLVILFAVAGGAFLLLYQQLKQLSNTSAPPATAISSSPPAVPPTVAAPVAQPAAAAPVAAVMATPLPLSELPVQTPAVSANLPRTTALTKSDFTLGSIVCENNDCIASLNGRSVRVGDVIKDYKIVAIDSTSIRMEGTHGQGDLTLSLFD